MSISVRKDGQGATLSVSVRPGSSADRVLGEHGGALKVAVTAAPEKGKANKAVCVLIAKALGYKKSQVAIVKGETSRDKQVYIAGTTPEEVAKRISERIQEVGK